MTPSFDNLQQVMEAKNYPFFTEGEHNLNLIFHRTTNLVTNIFDDFCYVAYRENGLPKVDIFKANTKCGINPVLCSAVVPGYYPHALELEELGIPPSSSPINPFQYDYLRSIVPISTYMVQVGQKEIVPTAVQHLIAGKINAHLQGVYGGSGHINNFSEGCMGWDFHPYNGVMPIFKKNIKTNGKNILSFGLLENKDFDLLNQTV